MTFLEQQASVVLFEEQSHLALVYYPHDRLSEFPPLSAPIIACPASPLQEHGSESGPDSQQFPHLIPKHRDNVADCCVDYQECAHKAVGVVD